MSRLRITGGQLRGRVLRESLPPGVRPTTDRVREALFSMLGQDLQGLHFLDAYGGSGVVGIEAWSRGARVTIVERDRRVVGSLKRRAREAGVTWRLIVGDVLREAARLEPVDIVFADPPYALDPEPIARTLAPLARRILIIEAASVGQLPASLDGLERDRTRSYGRTELAFYRRPDPPGAVDDPVPT